MTKLAALFGCNYENSPAQLNGCINDVIATRQLLITNMNYKKENILMLTDHTNKKPTKKNIINVIKMLAKRSCDEENISHIWLSFSGHGTNISDKSKDEKDGLDECLCPLDYETHGIINDDTINKLLCLFNEKVNLMFLVDCCHSGTMLDLPYRYLTINQKSTQENKNSKVKCKCMMISGCRDNQVSMDAYDINHNKQFSGALTSSLLHVLRRYDYTISIHILLLEIRKFLRKNKFEQVPQICCTFKVKKHMMFAINQNSKPFV